MLRVPEPVVTAGLFAPLRAELLALLGALAPAEWERPTGAGGWRVRDVVAHLLDGDLRKLSSLRDGHAPPPPAPPVTAYAELVRFLDRLNGEWVAAATRISPRLLTELLAWTGPQVDMVVASLDPGAPALHPVAWAGESISANWFDIGREYTERWHHQQQIRAAVGVPLLEAREWLHPVLALSMRALPHAYRQRSAVPGAAVVVTITGDAGDSWSLVRNAGGWDLFEGASPDPACVVTLEAGTAWRVFFNALSPQEAAGRISVRGDRDLAAPFVAARAVMVAIPREAAGAVR